MSNRWPALLALGLGLGCSEYTLDSPTKEPGASDSAVETGLPSDTVCADLYVPAEEIALEATCAPFEVSSFTPVVEQYWEAMDCGVVLAAPLVVGAAVSLLTMTDEAGLVRFDPLTGAEEVLAAFPNDGEASAVGMDPDGQLIVAAADYSEFGLHVAEAGVTEWTVVGTTLEVAPSLAVVEDRPIVLFAGEVFDGAGSSLVSTATRFNTTWTIPSDIDADGVFELITSAGAYTFDGVAVAEWDRRIGIAREGWIQVFPVSTASEVAWLVVDGFGPIGLAADGTAVWSGLEDLPRDEVRHAGSNAAVGDTNGDNDPDVCLVIDNRVVVLTSAGATLLDEATDDPLAGWSGGCAMADLDADGNHEIIVYGGEGLRIYDVETSTLLGENTDVCTHSWRDAPAVADVDGDGSAEIVVSGDGCGEHAYETDGVYVLGPATGRWARTRPVWNQLAYDPTLIGDDGRLLATPLRNQDTVNGLRAQPARDGHFPDLVPELLDTCAICDGETVQLSVRVVNKGSAEAEAGARVVLSSVERSGRLTAVTSATYDVPIARGTSAAAVVLEVPRSVSAHAWVLDVHGADTDECDPLNDRLPVTLPEPCDP